MVFFSFLLIFCHRLLTIYYLCSSIFLSSLKILSSQGSLIETLQYPYTQNITQFPTQDTSPHRLLSEQIKINLIIDSIGFFFMTIFKFDVIFGVIGVLDKDQFCVFLFRSQKKQTFKNSIDSPFYQNVSGKDFSFHNIHKVLLLLYFMLLMQEFSVSVKRLCAPNNFNLLLNFVSRIKVNFHRKFREIPKFTIFELPFCLYLFCVYIVTLHCSLSCAQKKVDKRKRSYLSTSDSRPMT